MTKGQYSILNKLYELNFGLPTSGTNKTG